MITIEQYLVKKYTPQTVLRYMRSITLYLQVKTTQGANRAKYREIWDYLGTIRSKNYASGYINTELVAIKAYYKYLVHIGIRIDNPSVNIYLNDDKKRARQVQHQDLFTPAELELLLNKPTRYQILENRDRLIISFYIYQGMTTGEIANITLANINLDEETIYIPSMNKKINSRIIPLKRKQLHFAERYIHLDRDCLMKTQTDKLLLNKLGNVATGESLHYLIECQRALFPARKLNPKTIRQSVITNWFREGKGIKDVQIMAGHKYPSTTEMYKPVDLGALHDSIELFHPLGLQ